MQDMKQNLIAVNGNVYYCKFRERPTLEALRAQAEVVVRDINLAVDSLGNASRDIRATDAQLRETVICGSAALSDLAEAIEEIAFQSHLVAVDYERGGAPMEVAQEMRQLARSGAAAAGDLREWAVQALSRSQNATRLLGDIAARIQAATRSVDEKLGRTTATDPPPPVRH